MVKEVILAGTDLGDKWHIKVDGKMASLCGIRINLDRGLETEAMLPHLGSLCQRCYHVFLARQNHSQQDEHGARTGQEK